MGLKDPAFRRRLGTYLFGVAIGCVLLGWFQMNRHRAVQAQQAAEEAAQAEEAREAGSETPPPEPRTPPAPNTSTPAGEG